MEQVAVIMGSTSDWETMKHSCEILEELGIPYIKKVVSAHRTPDLMFSFAENAREKGLKVIIAGAGGAAHLPGMVAAKTTLPVIGVPVQSRTLNGLDSLLSIVQMPGGSLWIEFEQDDIIYMTGSVEKVGSFTVAEHFFA